MEERIFECLVEHSFEVAFTYLPSIYQNDLYLVHWLAPVR